MTPDEAANSKFNGFSILKLEDKRKVLILLCETKEMADSLYDLLRNSNYKLKVGIAYNKTYRFEIDFTDEGFAFQYDTKMTAEGYPPLLWLGNHTVTLITTGIKGERQQRFWNDKYLPLHRPRLN